MGLSLSPGAGVGHRKKLTQSSGSSIHGLCPQSSKVKVKVKMLIVQGARKDSNAKELINNTRFLWGTVRFKVGSPAKYCPIHCKSYQFF